METGLSPCRAPGDEEAQAENLITANGMSRPPARPPPPPHPRQAPSDGFAGVCSVSGMAQRVPDPVSWHVPRPVRRASPSKVKECAPACLTRSPTQSPLLWGQAPPESRDVAAAGASGERGPFPMVCLFPSQQQSPRKRRTEGGLEKVRRHLPGPLSSAGRGGWLLPWARLYCEPCSWGLLSERDGETDGHSPGVR